MDDLVETLQAKLCEWKPETVAQVREGVQEIISLADQEALDLLRSRAVEQEVLDALDEPASR
jgi:predicted ATP-dependent serine protease